jgi:hypothetical protein
LGATDCRTLMNRSEMHREDLLSPDLVSEVVLMSFGVLILVSLLLFLANAISFDRATNF